MVVISTNLAGRLRDAGFAWQPASGDTFCFDSNEFDGEVFTVSDMTIEPHEFDTGTILGFNGTTEWALDSVALENTLWLPREDQLREALGDAFGSLVKIDGAYIVELGLHHKLVRFDAESAADAYALAVLSMLRIDSSFS